MSEEKIIKIAWLCIRDRRVLFARSYGKELFYTVGGKPENGETDTGTLCREVEEEASVRLILDSIEYLNTFQSQADGKAQGVHVEIRCYQADFIGTLLPANEIEELAWFSSCDMHRTTPTGKLVLDWLKSQGYID